MSQAGILSDSTSPGPDIETLTPDSGGAVSPVANNIDVNGQNGIVTSNGGAGVLIISDRFVRSGTAQTVGATTQVAITVALSAGQTLAVQAVISGYESTTPAGVGGQIVGVVSRLGGAAASIVGTPDKIYESSAALAAADFDLDVSGNNAILTVTGVAGLTVDWQIAAFVVTAP